MLLLTQPTAPTENIYYEIHSGIIEQLLANPYAGDGTVHPDMHLIYVDEICGLFKLAGLSGDGVKKKVFPLSLEGKALTWYRLCDDTQTWDWNRLKLEFHQKFYPMHLVHRDRNYIYNFWPSTLTAASAVTSHTHVSSNAWSTSQQVSCQQLVTHAMDGMCRGATAWQLTCNVSSSMLTTTTACLISGQPSWK